MDSQFKIYTFNTSILYVVHLWKAPKGLLQISARRSRVQYQFFILFNLIHYVQHTVSIQYHMRNPYKQASVLVCNLENCYNTRNGSIMFYSFNASLIKQSSSEKNKGKNNKWWKHKCAKVWPRVEWQNLGQRLGLLHRKPNIYNTYWETIKLNLYWSRHSWSLKSYKESDNENKSSLNPYYLRKRGRRGGEALIWEGYQYLFNILT